MVQVNEYFNGNVKSLTVEASSGKSTVGVMNAGEYEFSTGLKEIMTVVAGSMAVKLPGAADWQTYGAGQKFEVVANSKFQLKITADVAYLCEFIA
jgi:uncharacterized protein YaiE (UPF0345 family)